MLAVERDVRVVLVLGQVTRAEGDAAPILVVVVLVAGAAGGVDGAAGELLARNDVDDARHRVCAIYRRRTRLQDLDPFHDVHWNLVEIDERVLAIVGKAEDRQATAVHQDERVLRSQAAQRNARRALRKTEAGPRVGHRAVVVGSDLADDIGYRIEAGGIDILTGNYLHRRSGFGFGTLDIRARDFLLFDRTDRGLSGCRRGNEHRHAAGTHDAGNQHCKFLALEFHLGSPERHAVDRMLSSAFRLTLKTVRHAESGSQQMARLSPSRSHEVLQFHPRGAFRSSNG